MKIAVSIPDPIFNSAESFAKESGLSRSQLYATALKSFLRNSDKSNITSQLNRIYESEDSSFDAYLQNMQHRSIPHESW